jgi:hypothetical protein
MMPFRQGKNQRSACGASKGSGLFNFGFWIADLNTGFRVHGSRFRVKL